MDGEYNTEKEKRLAEKLSKYVGEKDKLSSSASSERMIQKAELRLLERAEARANKRETTEQMRRKVRER